MQCVHPLPLHTYINDDGFLWLSASFESHSIHAKVQLYCLACGVWVELVFKYGIGHKYI